VSSSAKIARSALVPLWARLAACLAFASVLAPGPVAAQTAARAVDAAGADLTFAPMLERALPAVVSIRASGETPNERLALADDPRFGQLIGEIKGPATRKFQSNGSGVIVDAEAGHVMTNYHVIEGAAEVKVRLTDGREFVATVIGSDPATDVALLRIAPIRLMSLTLGHSLAVRVGDLVFAIGNPLGLEATATMGMVSSLRRSTVGYRHFEGYIQHDAPVNSGNSGGALLNLKGELIGINTAIISPSGGSVGLGFAIPSGIAVRIARQLVKYGKVNRGHIGAKTVDVRPELYDTYGLTVVQGAFVRSTLPGSPAQAAGLAFADVITAIHVREQPRGPATRLRIDRASQLETFLSTAEVGEDIEIDVMRRNVPLSLKMKVADIVPEPERLEIPPTILRLAGVKVQSLPLNDPAFGTVWGVQVVEVRNGTLADFVGLQPGDIITAVDKERVTSIDDLVELAKGKTQKFDLSIVRRRAPMRVQFPL
jgi:Do/DeqQ family serine protease